MSIRLKKELEKLDKNPNPCLEIISFDDFTNMYCKIHLPPDCKYPIKMYNLHIVFSNNYPFTYPTVQFLEKVEPEHEFIDNYKRDILDNIHGNLCSDFIAKNWGPTILFINLIEKICNLLMTR